VKTLRLKLDETDASLEHSLEMACTSCTVSKSLATNAKNYKLQTT